MPFHIAVPIDSFTDKYAFLSNFYPSVININGLAYPTVEHAFQAAKTDDPAMRERIRLCRTPGEAKKLGRSGDVVLRAGWDNMRIDIMRYLLDAKFQKPTLRQKLIDTYPAELIEGNTWGDTYWGMIWKGNILVGENHLGKLLEALRFEIMQTEAFYA